LVVLALAGCGFRGLPSDGDSGFPPGADLAGLDLSQMQAGTGPGPLGALPPGACCSGLEQCAGRRCGSLGTGPYFCTEYCQFDDECNWFNPLYHCDTATSLCMPLNDPYECTDPSKYHYGTTPTGGCCAPGPTANQPCAGGVCVSTGNSVNPFYCTQGCGPGETCPSGYVCFSNANGFSSDLRQCWHAATTTDPNATYTCQ
jgi:hypothetical protein